METFINWFEIPAGDFHRAVKFYGDVFGIQFETIDSGGEQMAFFPEMRNGVRGAISRAENFNPSAVGMLINFHGGNDLNEILEKVEKYGGKTLIPKTAIEGEGHGYFATFLDSEGNRIGVNSRN